MTFSKIGRILTASVATAALGLGMTACGGGTVGYMWVLGTFYNQITGFLVDDYTGNLTGSVESPYSSGGANPVSIVVKPGGRYVYVINSGTGMVGTPGAPGYVAPTSAGIAEFSVGGGGGLTFEQNFFSTGVDPVWAALDTSGNYLYVLDKYAPDYSATNPNGSITAFQIAGDTGRLTLIPNTGLLINGKPQTWFEVGPNPTMTKIGGGCLYTLSSNSIYPLAVTSGGQLTVPTNGPYIVPGSNKLTSINTSGGSFIYLTDGPGNQIFSLQSGGGGCNLASVVGGLQANLPGTANPVNSLTSSNGQFLFVINQSLAGQTTTAYSSISAFHINAQGQLERNGDATNNPYSVGAGPVCIVADPTNQYIYISNSLDSTVTGKLLDQNRGFLSDLSRGSVFPTGKTPTCLAVSGNI